MSIVASFVYRDGMRLERIAFEEARPPEDADTFIWIGLNDPTEAELAKLKSGFRLHALAVEDALSSGQVPKVHVYEEQLFVIVKTAHLEDDEIVYGSTAIFVGPRHIITVRLGSARGHSELRNRLEASPQTLKHGPGFILHAIIDFVVDGYVPIVQRIEDEVLGMEHLMLDAFLERDQIKRIFRLRREVAHFQRVIGPTSELCGKLAHLDLPCLDRQAKPYFRDVLDHCLRVETTVGGLREVITSVFEASNLLEQQRQGAITRQLAAWAAILAVPTAIAGIYGMNFVNMPELKTQYGYYVVLVVIFGLCSGLFIRFRRAKWI